MITGLKKTLPIVIKVPPESKLTGNWIVEKFIAYIIALAQLECKVRGIVNNNHSANVAAFNILLKQFAVGDLFITHPKNQTVTYLFFDNIYLLNNRNNLCFTHFFYLLKTVLLHRHKLDIYHG